MIDWGAMVVITFFIVMGMVMIFREYFEYKTRVAETPDEDLRGE